MRLPFSSLLAIVVFAVLAFAGGPVQAAPPSKAATSLNARRAKQLATSLANAASKRRFGVAPFSASSATPQFVHGRWQWQAAAGYGHTDLLASVSFSRSGMAPTASVDQIVLPQW